MNWLRKISRIIWPVTSVELVKCLDDMIWNERDIFQRTLNRFMVRSSESYTVPEVSIHNDPDIVPHQCIALKKNSGMIHWQLDRPALSVNGGPLKFLYTSKEAVGAISSRILIKDDKLLIGDFVLFEGLSGEDLIRARAGLIQTMHDL